MSIFARIRKLLRVHIPMSERFVVTWDDECVYLDDRWNPRKPARAEFQWTDIERICFHARDFTLHDWIHIFVTGRGKSYTIPVAAGNGGEFWDKILKRGLFDPDLSDAAFRANEGLFCWPPPTPAETAPPQ